jgi:hypothetical protein
MNNRHKLPEIDLTKVKRLNEGCNTEFNLFGVSNSSFWSFLTGVIVGALIVGLFTLMFI